MIKKTSSLYWQSLLFLILAQVMVGVNIVTSKHLLVTTSIFFLMFMRFLIAALCLFAMHWLTPAKKTPLRQHLAKLNRRDWFFILAQAACAGILFNGIMLAGLERTDANLAGVITSVLPAIIAIMAWQFLGDTFSVKARVAVFVACLGLLAIGIDKVDGVASTHSILGDALIMLALIPEAAYYILSKVHKTSLPLFLISGILNGLNALFIFCLLPWIQTEHGPLLGPESIILLILGLSAGFFYVFWFVGCSHVDSATTALATAGTPISTVLLAWAVLGEKLTFMQAIGMGLVILSIVIQAYRRR